MGFTSAQAKTNAQIKALQKYVHQRGVDATARAKASSAAAKASAAATRSAVKSGFGYGAVLGAGAAGAYAIHKASKKTKSAQNKASTNRLKGLSITEKALKSASPRARKRVVNMRIGTHKKTRIPGGGGYRYTKLK